MSLTTTKTSSNRDAAAQGHGAVLSFSTEKLMIKFMVGRGKIFPAHLFNDINMSI